MAVDSLAIPRVTLQRQYGLDDLTKDLDGRRIFLVPSPTMPYLVWSNRLEYDVYIFVNFVEIRGWLPIEAVEETIPRVKKVRGKAVDYSHLVDVEALNPMPEEFRFVETCTHDAAYWQYDLSAWRCFICDRVYYRASDRDAI